MLSCTEQKLNSILTILLLSLSLSLALCQIPIQTLKAVNDLVQSIAGNLQQAGSGSYFRARSSNVRNINVNVDEEEEAEGANETDGKKKKKLDEKN